MKLLKPNEKIIKSFNSLWEKIPDKKIRIFEDSNEEIDLCDCIDVDVFKKLKKNDNIICDEDDLKNYFVLINNNYHTRVSKIKKIVNRLSDNNINRKRDLEKEIKEKHFSVSDFVKLCRQITGRYEYSFASKVFNFIDGNKYPIVDSYVVTMLDEYNKTYEYNKKFSKTKWGDYNKYIENYDCFKKFFKLNNRYSYKDIDKFLWTYGKVLEGYWSKIKGVLKFESVSFNPDTNTEKK